MQSIFKNKYKRDFTVIGNKTLEDDKLTFEARGLLCFLLAKPTDWTVIMQHLINSSPAGKHVVSRIVNELIENRYMVKSRIRNEKGRFVCTLYEVFDKPQPNIREVGKQGMENPEVDKQPLQKKQAKKNTNNKETTTTNEPLMDELRWPKKALREQKRSILKLSDKEDAVVVQKILDVISQSGKEVENLVGLYRHLLILNRQGELDSSILVLSQRKREQADLAEKRHKEQMKLSEERILKYVRENDPTKKKYE